MGGNNLDFQIYWKMLKTRTVAGRGKVAYITKDTSELLSMIIIIRIDMYFSTHWTLDFYKDYVRA